LLETIRFYSDQNPAKFFAGLILIVGYAVIVPCLVDGGCLSRYDELTNSIKLFNEYSFSTKFIRSLHPSDCDGNLSMEPCHVYVTASEPDPSTNMIINF
jgi:hypothetical protein